MKTFTGILALVLALPSFAQTNAGANTAEVAVIKAVLDVHQKTVSGKTIVSKKTYGEFTTTAADPVQRSFADLAPELINDYKSRNAKPVDLDLGVALPLTKGGIFDYAKIDAKTVLEVSRPGLSTNGAAAIVRLTEFAKDALPRPFTCAARRDDSGNWTVEVINGPLF